MSRVSVEQYAAAFYDQTHYRQLRPFVVDVLGKRLGQAATRENDGHAAAELLARGDLTSAEHAAARLLAVISAPAAHVTEPDALRAAAADLAPYLPEAAGARLCALVAGMATLAAGPDPVRAAGKRWTPERIAEAQAMRDRLKAEGRRDYTKATAKHYDVAPAFLRRLLGA